MNRMRTFRIALTCAVALSAWPATAAAQAAPSPDATPFVGATGAFIALSVLDLEASSKWYMEKLGLRRVMTIPRMGQIVGGAAFEADGIVVELIQHEAARPGSTPSELTHGIAKAGLIVTDFDRTVAALRARGITFFGGPYPARPGQRANVMFHDNAGNMLQVLGPLAPR
jgi:catechol 2,3-dioxygenase-like lactoylglutathione lyase family enzyme